MISMDDFRGCVSRLESYYSKSIGESKLAFWFDQFKYTSVERLNKAFTSIMLENTWFPKPIDISKRLDAMSRAEYSDKKDVGFHENVEKHAANSNYAKECAVHIREILNSPNTLDKFKRQEMFCREMIIKYPHIAEEWIANLKDLEKRKVEFKHQDFNEIYDIAF